jgi:hypothetical protein
VKSTSKGSIGRLTFTTSRIMTTELNERMRTERAKRKNSELNLIHVKNLALI